MLFSNDLFDVFFAANDRLMQCPTPSKNIMSFKIDLKIIKKFDIIKKLDTFWRSEIKKRLNRTDIVKIASMLWSFCLCHYVQNSLSYSGEEI